MTPGRATARPGPRVHRVLLGIVAAFAVAALLQIAFGPGADAQEGEPSADQLERGRQLFGQHCALCHGEAGRGNPIDGPSGGPDISAVGPANVDFVLRTGRMPLESAQDRVERSEPHFTPTQREAIVAFVASLAPEEGVPIPDVDGWEDADLSEGLELFTSNCAACHGPTAAGIAVGQRDVSSNLDVASPIEIAEAVRVGPGRMPVFSEEAIPQDQLEAIVRWVVDLRERAQPGGASIGRSGPVTEGFVAWVLGFGLLAIVMYLLGERAHGDEDDDV